MPKLYSIKVEGCVEPELHGPYASEEERIAKAKELNASHEDIVFRLDINDQGEPEVSSFGNYEMEDEDEE